ncbi:MAG: DUF1700 domain-containing protein [Clostridia bacterium]|nr:DUF1700 domain-containing protein [Clostridia bacterium]
MKKDEFLKRLSDRLLVLSKKERDDIIYEYSQHIDMKTAEGQSEEDAIADFGDLDELAREILRAYDLDPDYASQNKEQEHTFEKKVADKVSRLTDWMNRTADSLSKKNAKQIFGIVIKFILLIILLVLLRIPAGLLTAVSMGAFRSLPYSFGSMIGVIMAVLINVIYIAVVCYALYFFFQRVASDKYTGEKEARDFVRGMNNEPYEASGESETNKENGEKAKNGEKPRYHGFTWQNRTPDGAGASAASEKGSSPSAAHVFGSVLGVILKIVVVIIMIPVIIIAVAAVAGLGASIALVVQGFGIIGIMLIALGCTLCLLSLIWAVFKALFGKKQPKEKAAPAQSKEV